MKRSQYPSNYAEVRDQRWSWDYFVSMLEQYGVEFKSLPEEQGLQEIEVLPGIDRKIAWDLYLKYFIVNNEVVAC